MINTAEILESYYDTSSKLYQILIEHSLQVCDKALAIVDAHPELGADRQFVEEAAMLHDIGIFLTYAPKIHCLGKHKYIEHGYLGADLLRGLGLYRHALVCERHTGVGLSLNWIKSQGLPLPHRDMRPVTIEEQIICYADLFFSKTKLGLVKEMKKIVQKLNKFDAANGEKFKEWHDKFAV